MFRNQLVVLSLFIMLPFTLKALGQECSRSFKEVRGPVTFGRIFVANDGRKYTVGGNGEIMIRTDQNLLERHTGSKVDLNGVYFIDGFSGYVVGEGGSIFVTHDGAVSWKPLDSGTRHHLRAISCRGPSNCWAVGDKGTVVFTTDGESWSRSVTGFDDDLFAVSFDHQRSVWVGGDSGRLARLIDGRSTWKTIKTLQSNSFRASEFLPSTWKSIYFFDAEFGCVSSSFVAACTSDGGNSWARPSFSKTIQNNSSFPLVGLAEVSNRPTFLVSCIGDFVTTDRGQTWSHKQP